MEQPPTPDAMAPELPQQPVRKVSWKWILVFLVLLIPIASSAFWAGRESVKQGIHPTITPTIQTEPTISPTNSQIGGLVKITSINPISGPVKTSVTIFGSGFAAKDNTVTFGTDMGSSYLGYPSNDGKTITFIVPTEDNPRCPDTVPRCPLRAPDPILPGVYDVSVSNSSGTSNTVQFTVTGNTASSTYSAGTQKSCTTAADCYPGPGCDEKTIAMYGNNSHCPIPVCESGMCHWKQVP